MFSGEEEGDDGVKEEESKNRREEKESEATRGILNAARLFSPSE